jgi:iron complex transport system ATP-binding protein
MDEPTAHLDLKHQIAALETARRFADEGGGVLCILHDIALAGEFADEAILLKSGRIFARGAPGEVLTPRQIGTLFDLSTARRPQLASIVLDRQR